MELELASAALRHSRAQAVQELVARLIHRLWG